MEKTMIALAAGKRYLFQDLSNGRYWAASVLECTPIVVRLEFDSGVLEWIERANFEHSEFRQPSMRVVEELQASNALVEASQQGRYWSLLSRDGAHLLGLDLDEVVYFHKQHGQVILKGGTDLRFSEEHMCYITEALRARRGTAFVPETKRT